MSSPEQRKRRSPHTVSKAAEFLSTTPQTLHTILRKPDGNREVAARLHGLATQLETRATEIRTLGERFEKEDAS